MVPEQHTGKTLIVQFGQALLTNRSSVSTTVLSADFSAYNQCHVFSIVHGAQAGDVKHSGAGDPALMVMWRHTLVIFNVHIPLFDDLLLDLRSNDFEGVLRFDQ